MLTHPDHAKPQWRIYLAFLGMTHTQLAYCRCHWTIIVLQEQNQKKQRNPGDLKRQVRLSNGRTGFQLQNYCLYFMRYATAVVFFLLWDYSRIFWHTVLPFVYDFSCLWRKLWRWEVSDFDLNFKGTAFKSQKYAGRENGTKVTKALAQQNSPV
jgi:hypothetical protein